MSPDSLQGSTAHSFPSPDAVSAAVFAPTAPPEAAPVCGGGASHGANRGGTGAPPSNTAPGNSIPFAFQPLRWGIDSLYLSFHGTLDADVASRLAKLKKLAQGPDHDASKAQYVVGNHIFEVKDKSSGLFAFTLVDDAYMIRLAGVNSKTVPMAYVKVSSRLLASKTVDAISDELRTVILPALGSAFAPRVSRVDLFLDFASDLDMESWGREAWVTRAAKINGYAVKGNFTGWSIGEGGAMMARLYHKLIEIQGSGKTYLADLWKLVGWDGNTPVWRLEFEFKREVLTSLGLDGLPSVLGALDGLWSYATTEWLRLAVPNPADQTRSRWPIHPLWCLAADVDWQADGGPLARHYNPSRAPSTQWLGQRALSLIASMGSIKGHYDFDRAADALFDAAHYALGDKYSLTGISTRQGFAEMVAAYNRKHCSRVNDSVADNDQEDGPAGWDNLYRQHSQGGPLAGRDESV